MPNNNKSPLTAHLRGSWRRPPSGRESGARPAAARSAATAPLALGAAAERRR